MRDGTRHPTRGFVAYDPEGYFLEFERFLDHPQNSRLLAAAYRHLGFTAPQGRDAPLGWSASVCSAMRTRGRFGVQKHFGVGCRPSAELSERSAPSSAAAGSSP